MAIVTVEDDRNVDAPVFYEEIPEEIDDSWSFGVLVGGLASAHRDLGIARSYKNAADRLIDRGVYDDDLHEIGLPALFLYRQSVESLIKALLVAPKLTHDLAVLLGDLEGERGPLPEKLRKRIMEMHRFDPRADAFRFFAGRPKKAKPASQPAGADDGPLHFPNEVWVDLRRLQLVVNALFDELDARAHASPKP